MRVKCPDIGTLHGCAGRHDASPGADLGRSVAAGSVRAGMAYQAVDIAGGDALALAHTVVNGVQHLAADLRGRLRSRQRDDIAVSMGFDAKSALDEGEVGIILAEQVGKQPVVVEGY